MAKNINFLNNYLENIIAITENLFDNISNNTKEAYNAIEIELKIQKLEMERRQKNLELGKKVAKTNKIDKDILEEINKIGYEIRELKRKKKETINKKNQQ